MLAIKRSDERGKAEHGWLKSRHSFSFAEYFDPKHMGFGTLRVINEDWVQGGQGFGAHPHRDMEIITYVTSGQLAHRDSLGSTSVMSPNEVQRMTAGSGIVHSEMNPDPDRETHLFQIWIKPDHIGLTPSYGQKSFADELNSGQLVLVVSRDGRLGSIPIHQDVDLSIARFKEPKTTTVSLRPKRSAWVQVIAGKVTVNGHGLEAGDAAAIEDESTINLTADAGAEVMVFDLKAG